MKELRYRMAEQNGRINWFSRFNAIELYKVKISFDRTSESILINLDNQTGIAKDVFNMYIKDKGIGNDRIDYQHTLIECINEMNNEIAFRWSLDMRYEVDVDFK